MNLSVFSFFRTFQTGTGANAPKTPVSIALSKTLLTCSVKMSLVSVETIDGRFIREVHSYTLANCCKLLDATPRTALSVATDKQKPLKEFKLLRQRHLVNVSRECECANTQAVYTHVRMSTTTGVSTRGGAKGA